MGMCSSDERAAKAPKVVRVVAYTILPGKEAELRAMVDAEAASTFASVEASLVIFAIAGDKLCSVMVFDTEAQCTKYMNSVMKEKFEKIKPFVSPKAEISEQGPKFYQSFKPVAKGQNLRIVVFPGHDIAKVRQTAKQYRESLPNKKIPGFCGGAYAENKSGALFGYQAFDNAASCSDYNNGAIKAFAAAGLTGDAYKHAEGEVIFASAKASLFDEMPGAKDVRQMTGTVFDTTEGIFQNVPLGNYVIDGVTYTVETTQGGVDQVVSKSKEGVVTTYTIGADSVKMVPGGEQVVTAGESGYAMGADAAGQGLNATNQVTNTVTSQAYSTGNQAYDASKGAAQSVPGVNEATNATMQGVDAAKGVSNQATGYVNQGVDASTGAVKAVPGVNEAVSAGEAGYKAGQDGLKQVEGAADGGLQAAGSAAAQGKEASQGATRSCF